MELQAKKIIAPERDVTTTSSGSTQSRIVDGVLALVNGVSEITGAIFDVQSAVEPITVRMSVPIRNYFHPPLD